MKAAGKYGYGKQSLRTPAVMRPSIAGMLPLSSDPNIGGVAPLDLDAMGISTTPL